MSLHCLALVAGVLLTAGALQASDTSEAAVVFTETDTTSFWRTARVTSFDVDLVYPVGASSVTIDVRGQKFHRRWEGVTAASQAISLPPAVSAEDENVYQLTLAFDNATTQACSFAVVRSQASGAAATATFGQVSGVGEITRKSVLPIPYGATGLTVDDVAVSTGLDGAAGWYVCGKMSVGAHDFTLTTGEDEFDARLDYLAPGLLLFLR